MNFTFTARWKNLCRSIVFMNSTANSRVGSNASGPPYLDDIKASNALLAIRKKLNRIFLILI